MDCKDYIHSDPEIMPGKPVIKGTVMRSINDWMVYVVDPAIYLKVEKRSL
jgi:hypothetical protein